MIPDASDLAEYILMNYRNKVVEIGVGNQPQVALLLKAGMDVIITDVNPQPEFKYGILPEKYSGIRFCSDDIFNPDMQIYKTASLIYSIRPPIDLQEAIAKVAREVGADLIIRPFGNEKAELKSLYKNHCLINYKRSRFFLYKRQSADI
ncbi:MAG TPA: UPF0146 family protein [Candidatus Methanoperedens sp.]